MTETHLSTETSAIADWCGSETDHSRFVTIRRCHNGVMVEPQRGPHQITDMSEVLVFQNLSHLWDWMQRWYEESNKGAAK
jgi:hypothetical protein